MKFARIAAMAKKEVMHILRDPFTIAMSIAFPMVLVIYFGFAIDFDFKGVTLAVYDQDNTRQSRTLLDVFFASGYFTLAQGRYPGAMFKDIESEEAFGAIIIPPGFGRDIIAGRQGHVQILIDGADNQKTGIVGRYITALQTPITTRFSPDAARSPVEIRTRFLYNPELNTQWFIVPGLMVVVIGLLAIFMTALTVAREWENGSMELLLSTPVLPMEIVLGKIAPYVAISLTGSTLVYLTARLVFGVPFAGSHLILLAAITLFIIACLAQGIMISVTLRQQAKATQVALIVGLLPSLILSGLIFPIESMPAVFRGIASVLPQRWFMIIIRGLFLKGASFAELATPFSALLLLAVIPVIAAAKKFKKDLEP